MHGRKVSAPREGPSAHGVGAFNRPTEVPARGCAWRTLGSRTSSTAVSYVAPGSYSYCTLLLPPLVMSSSSNSPTSDRFAALRHEPSATEVDLARLAALLDALASNLPKAELDALCSRRLPGIRAKDEVEWYAGEVRSLLGMCEEEWAEGLHERGRGEVSALLEEQREEANDLYEVGPSSRLAIDLCTVMCG